MGTRANIVVRDRDLGLTIYIYRHYDGYPKCVVPDILPTLQMNSVTDAVRHLLNVQDANYEMTDGIHGDIQHLYEVSVRGRGVRYASGYGDIAELLREVNVETLLELSASR